MATFIDLRSTTHNFEKQNLVTIINKREAFDIYKCKHCGLIGKREGFTEKITIDGRKKASAICPKNPNIKRKIRIIQCTASWAEQEKLIPNTEHDIVDPPEDKKHLPGIWVMERTEPLRLLPGEFTFISK